jgi:hypothetical protein
VFPSNPLNCGSLDLSVPGLDFALIPRKNTTDIEGFNGEAPAQAEARAREKKATHIEGFSHGEAHDYQPQPRDPSSLDGTLQFSMAYGPGEPGLYKELPARCTGKRCGKPCKMK